MDQQQFVDALNAHAAVAGAKDTLSQWESPRGRLQSQDKRTQAAWFNGLSIEDRRMVEALVADATRATLFGVLCILDGSRSIEPPGQAHLELKRVEGDRAALLASSNLRVAPLHELL
jgi:hypothetical protein